jgi:hypothetical protein
MRGSLHPAVGRTDQGSGKGIWRDESGDQRRPTQADVAACPGFGIGDDILEKPTLDRTKAAKVAALLASDKPGEVAAAASRLVAMLAAAGMTPSDLLCDKTDNDASRFDTSQPDTFALHKARAEAEHFKREVQRQRAWYEEMLRERDDALARLSEVEDQLEEMLPPLDWVVLAEAFRRANKRGINSNYAKTMEYLAYTNKLALSHKRTLREFSKSKRGKKAA